MSEEGPLWISEAEVVSMMDQAEAIVALEKGLLAESRGEAHNMVKTHVAWGNGSTLHAIGAVFPKIGFVGTKTWAHTEGGASPLLVLFDSNTGAVKAIVEAFALGQMRTGAASGVATQWLASPNAKELAIVGTGKQAMTQAAAVLAVRPIAQIRVFGRDQERRARFVSRLNEEFGVQATAPKTIAETVRGAQIITLVTRASEPFLTAEMVVRGAHINAVGAIVSSRAEVARDVLARCSRIVVDSVPSAQKLARELVDFFDSDQGGWQKVQSLGQVVGGQVARGADDDITLFKSLGMGISDLALGMEIYEKAVSLGLGRRLPPLRKVPPRLRGV